MKITDLIAQHLLDVHAGDNWTNVNIANTIEDINWKEAVTKTTNSPNSIVMLLHHISYWNRVVAQRGENNVPVINAANGFDVPEIHSEKEWGYLKMDNLQSAQELADVIRSFDEEKLLHPILPAHSSAYKNFQGQVEHVHYHLGQIVILKKAIRATAA